MLTKENVLLAIQNGKPSFTFDGRDFGRLCQFFEWEEHKYFNGTLAKKDFKKKEWTKENILYELEDDLDFAFEKALNKRGISASEMYGVIKMWIWILGDADTDSDTESDTESDTDRDTEKDDYTHYGLPFFKAVAIKYGFTNPIGDSKGNEFEFSTFG